MNVLVACEESQRVCLAFRAKGHNAFSCDILPCSGGHPEYHIQGDCLPLLSSFVSFSTMDGIRHFIDEWDLLIAFPPCTYMSCAGACRMYPKAGQLDMSRFNKAMLAKDFFMHFFNADIPKICIENPRPLRCVGLPKESCHIQPYEFGEPYSKLTYLWLKGLPSLLPTDILSIYAPYLPSGTSRFRGAARRVFCSSQIERSKTFLGVAAAMAEQWG